MNFRIMSRMLLPMLNLRPVTTPQQRRNNTMPPSTSCTLSVSSLHFTATTLLPLPTHRMLVQPQTASSALPPRQTLTLACSVKVQPRATAELPASCTLRPLPSFEPLQVQSTSSALPPEQTDTSFRWLSAKVQGPSTCTFRHSDSASA